MNLPEKPDKQIIMSMIQVYFDKFRIGDELRTDDVVKHIRNYHKRSVYPDTVLRYLRILRSDEKVNYTVTCKFKRTFKIIAIGDPHSI